MKTILNGIKTLVSGEIGKVRRSVDRLSRSVDELDAQVAEKAPKKMVAAILKNADGNWYADKTFSELVQHIKDGGTVEASYGGETLRYYWRSEDYLSFIRTRTYENDIDTVNLNIWSDDVVDVYVGHTQAVPSPSEVSKESIGKLLKISDVGIVDGYYQVTKTEAVDFPEGGGGSGGENPWVEFCTAEITEDVNELEFTGVDDYTDFLLIGDFAGGNTSGFMIYMNGKQVSTLFGSYFVHNHRKFNVTRLEIDKIRGFYCVSSGSQEYGRLYNQDSMAECRFGQTLSNGENITRFSFRVSDGKYIKAGSRYTLYAR